jgi:carbon starvation protein
MNAIPIVVAGLALYLLGYRFYAKYLAERIFKLDADAPVPSRTMEDGTDYVPTNRYVLFGHHFASIAGAAPIVGPAIAVIWGWLPALLWVVLGAVLMGCVHDFSALILSVRHKARSIGDLAGDIIGKKATTAYMVIMFFVVVLLMAIFLRLISGLLIRYPEVVIPAAALVIVAVAIGVLIYRTKVGLGVASIVGIGLMLLSVWIGTQKPLALPAQLVVNSPLFTWVFLLAIYSFVASVLPVWLLLQPRDYLESFKLYAGLILLFAGIIATRPTIVAPIIRPVVEGAPPIWPFLFVTIACGALTGFHSIVASGTTSKQLANEKDARFVGYGAMAGESALALGAVIACTAGFGSREAWMTHYGNWGSAAGLWQKVGAFVDGSAGFIATLGIPESLGKTFMGLIIVAFALTTLDSACRLGRYILAEFGRQHEAAASKIHTILGSAVGALKNGYVGSAIAAGLACFLALMPGVKPGQSIGQLLWPLFGTTNQLLAALVFATVTIYLVKRKTPHWFISVPLFLVAITTLSAMIWNIVKYVRDGNWILTAVASIILAAGLTLIVLSLGSFMRARSDTKEQA